MRPPRYVHYVAAGGRGRRADGPYAFDCYYAELRQRKARGQRSDGVGRKTDLRKVTCPSCWWEIFRMARAVPRTGKPQEGDR
jgi:hypothetical protein